MAWERLESSLACVAAVARAACPRCSSASTSTAELTTTSLSPSTYTPRWMDSRMARLARSGRSRSQTCSL